MNKISTPPALLGADMVLPRRKLLRRVDVGVPLEEDLCLLRAAPNDASALSMRGLVLSVQCDAWEVGPRCAAELKEAATHFDRAAALSRAPAVKAGNASLADWCRSKAEAMCR